MREGVLSSPFWPVCCSEVTLRPPWPGHSLLEPHLQHTFRLKENLGNSMLAFLLERSSVGKNSTECRDKCTVIPTCNTAKN